MRLTSRGRRVTALADTSPAGAVMADHRRSNRPAPPTDPPSAIRTPNRQAARLVAPGRMAPDQEGPCHGDRLTTVMAEPSETHELGRGSIAFDAGWGRTADALSHNTAPLAPLTIRQNTEAPSRF